MFGFQNQASKINPLLPYSIPSHQSLFYPRTFILHVLCSKPMTAARELLFKAKLTTKQQSITSNLTSILSYLNEKLMPRKYRNSKGHFNYSRESEKPSDERVDPEHCHCCCHGTGTNSIYCN